MMSIDFGDFNRGAVDQRLFVWKESQDGGHDLL
jgi:hypothetical protein